MRKHTLAQAIAQANTPGSDLSYACGALEGCPAGGWPQTQRALKAIADDLPAPRTFTPDDFVDAVFEVDDNERYRAR